ncbi:MAG: PAS domain S-box protein [Parvibaculum sp.]|nr:PAS domain S-box protein [Parvibaculum sp.]
MPGVSGHTKLVAPAGGNAAGGERMSAIRLELYRTIMRAYRGIPVLFPAISGAIVFTFQPAVPMPVITLWWLSIVAGYIEYAIFQRRFFSADAHHEAEADDWIGPMAIRNWMLNIVWLGFIPLFWQPDDAIQNLAILTVLITHVVMASQIAFHIVPIFLSVTAPIITAVIGAAIWTFDPVFMALGFACVPAYLLLVRVAGQQRANAIETYDLRFRNADLIDDLGQARDVSEAARRRAEEANDELQRREHHFRALVENAFDVVLVTDENAVIQYASPAAEKFGLSPEALIGLNSLKLLSKEQRDQVLNELASNQSGPSETISYELALPRNAGSTNPRDATRTVWIESSITNLVNDPNVRGYVINMRDITGRKRTETEQRNQFRVLRALAAGAPLDEVMSLLALGSEEANPSGRAAVFLIDSECNLVTCAAPHLPADFGAWVDEFWREQRHGIFGRIALAGTKIVTTDLQEEYQGAHISSYMRKADIQSLWFQPIVSHGGKVAGAFALYFPDAYEPSAWESDYLLGAAHLAGIAIERRRADEELKRATEAAELANRAKSKFLANMSHELRTPLNAIIGFSEIMRQEMFGPLGADRYREYTSDIQDSGRHLLNVIDDILDISKIEAGRYALEDEEVDLAAVLRWSVDIMRAHTMDKAQQVRLQVLDPMPVLNADQRAMRQIMLNLLSNAAKFTGEGGNIEVSVCLDDDGNLSISVRDDGIGIPEDKLTEVMEPFGQVDDTNARQHGGTGLGLPITKSLIEMHGGSFALESTVGEGTTARMTLPGWRLTWPADKAKAATP